MKLAGDVAMMQARGSWLILMCLAGLGWAAMIAIGHPFLSLSNCASGGSAISDGWRNLQAGLLVNPADRLVEGWAAMVLAMTPITLGPALTAPRDAAPEVPGALPLFVAGYGALWLLAGLALVPAALWVAGALPDRGAALTAMAATALAWRVSLFHRLASRLRRPSFPADASGPAPGRRALDGFRYGAGCVLTCWPLMLAPLVVHGHHIVLMMAATVLQWADHGRLRRLAEERATQQGPTDDAFRIASQSSRGHPKPDDDGPPVATLAHHASGVRHAAG